MSVDGSNGKAQKQIRNDGNRLTGTKKIAII